MASWSKLTNSNNFWILSFNKTKNLTNAFIKYFHMPALASTNKK